MPGRDVWDVAEDDEDIAGVASAARSALNAARALAREASSEAERRCFEALADRILSGILASKGDPEKLTRVGPAGNGLTLVEMLMVDDGIDRYRLAKAILRRWYWPKPSRSAVSARPGPHANDPATPLADRDP